MPAGAWNEFEEAARELRALEGLDGLAGWDQETGMPPKGFATRGTQRAVLRSILHERLVGQRLGDLLESAAALPNLNDRQRALIRVVRHDRDRDMALPQRL